MSTSRYWGTRTCEVCGQDYSRYFYPYFKQTRCSRACYYKTISARQIGSASHLWKGGKTDENRRLRNSGSVAEWRKAVFARDGYACKGCGSSNKKLTADHIRPWSLFPELRFDVANGRTLCWPCHCRIGVNPGQMNKEQKCAYLASVALP